MRLRVKFKKYGPVRFIGHLDVMRFFQKAIRRAGIDVAYTGGFSPHQIMTFASPLGVGLESNGEYMDIDVHSFGSCDDIKRSLNAVSAPGIEIVSVVVLPENAGNAMASVAAAEYSVKFRTGREPLVPLIRLVELVESSDSIMYTKEGKKGHPARDIDLKAGIYKFYLANDSICMLLNASSAGNVKPSHVIEALLNMEGESLSENALLITREDIYYNAGTENMPNLQPMDYFAIN